MGELESAVLAQLKRIVDPDLGADIVACGFVKELRVDGAAGKVSFVLELTTPARAQWPCARIAPARPASLVSHRAHLHT